jgi:hypothetical protein
MDDLRVLAWLRWRQFRDGLVYGLRILGYESGERLYGLYLLALLAFWVLAMGAYTFDQARLLGNVVQPADFANVLVWIPLAVFAGQVYVWVGALRSTPLKLSFADMSYIVGSPVNPAAAILLGFLRQVSLRMLLVIPMVGLFAVLLARVSQLDISLWDGLRVSGQMVSVALIIVAFTWTVAWFIGTLRLAFPALGRVRLIWVVPLLLVVPYYFMPDVVLFPGRMVLLAGYGSLPLWMPLLMIAITAVLGVGLLRYGSRINLIHAADESQVYARIQALGLMAWRQPNVQMQIRFQSSSAGLRKRWLGLPKNVSGSTAIAVRAALSYVRHPVMLLLTGVWGALLCYVAGQVIKDNFPIPLTVGWVVIAGLVSPVGLLYIYRADVEEPFLRQFLPLDDFSLLLADALLPLLVTIIGASIAWMAHGFSPDETTSGIMFIPALVLLQTLCGAYAVKRGENRALQTRLIAVVISYTVIGGAYAALQVTGALIALVLVLMTLVGLVGGTSG